MTVVDGEALSQGSVVGDPAALEAQRQADPSLDHLSDLESLFNDQLDAADLVLLSRADRLSAEIRGIDGVREIRFVSAEEALKEFRQRLVDRGAQCLIAAGHGHDFGAHQTHTTHVRRLTLHVDRTHVDDARQTESRACGRTCDTVLARARLGDDATRTESLRQQRLAERVVDFVGTGVREIFTLEPDVRAPCRG